MDSHEGQVTCPFAIAAEDTQLVYFNKIDFVNTFGKSEIGEMLDVVKAQKLIKDVPSEELILRTMHKDKVLEMCKPREHVFLDKETPRRIKKIILEHQDEEKLRSDYVKSMIASPKRKTGGKSSAKLAGESGREKDTPETIPKRNNVVPRNKWGQPIVAKAKIS